jgi:hypothetical protein
MYSDVCALRDTLPSLAGLAGQTVVPVRVGGVGEEESDLEKGAGGLGGDEEARTVGGIEDERVLKDDCIVGEHECIFTAAEDDGIAIGDCDKVPVIGAAIKGPN